MTFKELFIKHGLFYLLMLAGVLLIYWLIFQGVDPGKETPDKIVNVIHQVIISGLTSVSIVLPLTVAVLGYAAKEQIDCLDFLFFACICFMISTTAGLWNLFRLPGLVTTVNVANDFWTAIFQVTQLYSVLYGFIYLLLGAWKIVKKPPSTG